MKKKKLNFFLIGLGVIWELVMTSLIFVRFKYPEIFKIITLTIASDNTRNSLGFLMAPILIVFGIVNFTRWKLWIKIIVSIVIGLVLSLIISIVVNLIRGCHWSGLCL